MCKLLERLLVFLRLLPPAREGWDALVRAYAGTAGLWRDPVTGTFGLPVEWTLLRWDAGRLMFFEDTCCQTGRPVSGETVIVFDDSGNPVSHDGTRWGVRCARCARPLHWRQAGMRDQLDVPSCRKCRGRVEGLIVEVKG